jgi:hypothetical protein
MKPPERPFVRSPQSAIVFYHVTSKS